MNKKRSLLRRILIWRLKHINNRQFMMILSVLVGLSVGLSAVIIKNSVHYIQFLLKQELIQSYYNYLYFIYPLIGIFVVVVFTKFIIKQHVGHGIPSVLYAISKNRGQIKRHNMFSSIISSSLTVGFGGSVGLEGPTVATGAAIGSNIGQLFHLNYRQITLLLACACAGAMSAIFKAPIAALVFAMEVIMLDLTMAAIVPLLMASVSAALTSYFFLGQEVLYPFELKQTFQLQNIPMYVFLGLFTGIVSIYFTKIYVFIDGIFSKLKKSFLKLIIGGGILGVLLFFFPALYGEGYEVINECLHGNYNILFDSVFFNSMQGNVFIVLLVFSLLILLKVIATSLTFGSGGVGGIFAPTLFMGVLSGILFVKLIDVAGIADISDESNFALAAMGGCIAGVLHAPLTGIFLIAEITSGYKLFMPLMITSTVSYITVKAFVKNSVYTIQLAKRGELLTHHKDKVVLSLLKVEKLIETNFKTIHPDSNLGDLVKIVAQSSRNIFPVVDEENTFCGMITLDNIRIIMFKPELYKTTSVKSIMFMPAVITSVDDSMEQVAEKFHNTNLFNIPVIKDNKYIGFISRANLFSAYRKLLKDFSEE